MDHLSPIKLRLFAAISIAVIAAALCALSIPLAKGGPPSAPEKPAEKKTLSGAELYSISCSRCHQERYPTEFTSAQWKTIMTHMRVRANLPAAQAREILKYLQEDAGN